MPTMISVVILEAAIAKNDNNNATHVGTLEDELKMADLIYSHFSNEIS